MTMLIYIAIYWSFLEPFQTSTKLKNSESALTCGVRGRVIVYLVLIYYIVVVVVLGSAPTHSLQQRQLIDNSSWSSLYALQIILYNTR